MDGRDETPRAFSPSRGHSYDLRRRTTQFNNVGERVERLREIRSEQLRQNRNNQVPIPPPPPSTPSDQGRPVNLSYSVPLFPGPSGYQGPTQHPAPGPHGPPPGIQPLMPLFTPEGMTRLVAEVIQQMNQVTINNNANNLNNLNVRENRDNFFDVKKLPVFDNDLMHPVEFLN